MQNKFVDYVEGLQNKLFEGLIIGGLVLGAPYAAEAVKPDYKSLKDAGITVEQFERNKKQGKYIMPEKKHWDGELEPGETFDNYIDGVLKWCEAYSGKTLSRRRLKNSVEKFAKKKGIVLPKVVAPCWEQLQTHYIGELEDEIEELKEQYNSMTEEISKLRESLESRPDYTEKLNKIWKEIESLKKERESFREESYAQPEQPPVEEGYAQPPVVEGYGTPIFGEPWWFPGLPYQYFVLGTSIYCAVPFGDSFYYRRWGWFEPYGHGFRARGFDGRIFDYHGPSSLFRDYYSGHQRLPDGKHWKGREKDIGPHDRHRRELPREPGRRFEDKRWNDGRFDRRGFQRGEAPRMHEDGRNRTMGRGNIPRQEYRGTFPQGGNSPRSQHPNQQFNRGMQNRGPQGFPQGGGRHQNFQRGPQQGNPGRGFGQGGPAGHQRSGGRGR